MLLVIASSARSSGCRSALRLRLLCGLRFQRFVEPLIGVTRISNLVNQQISGENHPKHGNCYPQSALFSVHLKAASCQLFVFFAIVLLGSQH